MVRYVGQQTVVRCFSAQTVAWADLYPFAVRFIGRKHLENYFHIKKEFDFHLLDQLWAWSKLSRKFLR